MLSSAMLIAALAGGPPVAPMNGDYLACTGHGDDFKCSVPVQHRGTDYFEVESDPYITQYATVNWDVRTVDLSDEVKAKLKDKLINFVGYEFDIIRVLENGTERSAHAWEVYNHHYGNTIVGDGMKLVKTGIPDDQENPLDMHDDVNAFPGYRIVPEVESLEEMKGKPAAKPYSSQGLIMGNGAESRKTFHFLGQGYGAQVFSPYQAVLHPMLIDTTNREPKTDPATDPGHGRHGIVPKASNVGPEAMYSGLMECPCTDKWEKVFTKYSTLKAGVCKPQILKADDCFTAAQELGLRPVKRNSTVSNAKLPTGCSVSATVGGFDVIFNTNAKSNATCGEPAADVKNKQPPRVAGLAENLVNISVDLNPATDLATITLQGPTDVWFGVGLGAHGKFNPADPSSGLSMLGTNWTIIVLTNGSVMERDLGNHEMGTLLPASVDVVSSTVANGTRTVVMTRSIEGTEEDNMRFNPLDNSIPFINAIGNDDVFEHGHNLKATGVMYFFETAFPTCLCDFATDQGTLGGYAWGSQRCVAKPLGMMLDDPAFPENNNVNPTCLLKSYKGGLRCCKGGTVLLDKDQSVPQTNHSFKLKYRYYYQEGSTKTTKTPSGAVVPEVQDTFGVGWFNEAHNNEHDVPLCKSEDKDECRHVITSNITASDLGRACATGKGCKLITMEGHCHIGCIKMEMWIMDDPKNPVLLCRTEVDHGKSDAWMDETGYIAGAQTCVFGEGGGLSTPVPLLPTTKLLSLSVQNSTHARYGDMSLWEIRAAENL